MARTRTFASLIDDARKLVDVESAVDRFPSSEVGRYVNQGLAEVYDLLVEARGRAYFAKYLPSFQTADATDAYALPADFYKLVGVRLGSGAELETFDASNEGPLRAAGASTGLPTHYDLRGGSLLLLPEHRAGEDVFLSYVPAFEDLVDDSDTFDGVNGWEDYGVNHAAKRMALKLENYELANALDGDMARMRQRILGLAPTRNLSRPERVKDLRGTRGFR